MTGGQSSVDQVREVRRNLVIWEIGSSSVGQSSASQGLIRNANSQSDLDLPSEKFWWCIPAVYVLTSSPSNSDACFKFDYH